MQNCYPPYFRPFKSNGRGTWPTMWSPSVLQMLVLIPIFGMSRDQNKKRPKSQPKYARYCRHCSARFEPMFFIMLRMDFWNLCIFWELLHHKGSLWRIFLNSFKFVSRNSNPIRSAMWKTPPPLMQRRKWEWNPFSRSFSRFSLAHVRLCTGDWN